MVGQHFDQTIRTRNFTARSERFETGALVKSHKGRNVSEEKKWEKAFSGKQLDSVQEETPAVSVMREYLETGTNKDKKQNHPHLL